MKFKRLITLLMAVVLSLSLSVPCFASENNDIVFTTIPLDQIPDHVIPLEFDSEEEARAYILAATNQENNSNSYENSSISPRATNGTATVDTYSVGAFSGTIALKVNYGTSGDNHTGYIKYVEAFTTYTGWTLGFEWKEARNGASITSSGKDVYAYSEGVLEWYIILEGIGKYYSQDISLSGYAYLIH